MTDIAPTLRRFAGRCPPRGLIFLGAARREIATHASHRRATSRSALAGAIVSIAISRWAAPRKISPRGGQRPAQRRSVGAR